MKNHIAEVNSYIPIAKKRAEIMVKELGLKKTVKKGVDGREFMHDYFTEFFHNEMTRLLKQDELRR